MENLLGLIEMTQFKEHSLEYQQQQLELTESSRSTFYGTRSVQIESKSTISQFTFPENIPSGLIIDTKWSDDGMKDIKTKAHQIYNKYIKEGCSLEVNVSHKLRRVMKTKLNFIFFK